MEVGTTAPMGTTPRDTRDGGSQTQHGRKFETAAEADGTTRPTSLRCKTRQLPYGNGTDHGHAIEWRYVSPFADSTSEWISFFLMTVGEVISPRLSEHLLTGVRI
jgi:hypothetical protein